MGSSNQKTKTKTAPWKVQQPYIKDIFSQSQSLFNANKDPNADMKAAWDRTRANLNDPSSGYGLAKDYYTGILNSGGYDKNVFDNISSPILASINSQFMGSGRSGGGLQGIDLADTITKAYSPFAVQQANMAASNLPQLENAGNNALYSIGQQEYAYPWQNLQNYAGLAAGQNWGSQGTTTTPGTPVWQTLLGAGVGLAGSALSGGMIPPSVGMGVGSAAGSAFGSIY